MGYFPNGTAAQEYFDTYCAHCVHQNGPNGDSGCDIWLAHLIHNYDGDENSILHLLIPRVEKANERCRLFWPIARPGGGEPEPELTEADKQYLDWRTGKLTTTADALTPKKKEAA